MNQKKKNTLCRHSGNPIKQYEKPNLEGKSSFNDESLPESDDERASDS